MAGRGGDDGDDAPWLAAAELQRGPTLVPQRRFLIWSAVLALLLIFVAALVYATVMKPGDDNAYLSADGDIPLIRAPETPFKTRQLDGGIRLDGEGKTSYTAAVGIDPGGELAVDALPEEPLPRPTAPTPESVAASQMAEAGDAALRGPLPATQAPAGPAAAAPKAAVVAKAPATLPAPAKVAEKKPEPSKAAAKPSPDRLASLDAAISPAAQTSDSGSFALQLGAFSSNAKAAEVWKRFSGRFTYLADLKERIDVVERDEKKLYRLRATGLTSRKTAENFCQRLKVAGETCSVTE